jgi:hypothetical protein
VKFRYLAAAVLALVSAAFALDGQITIHDPSTIVQCDGKYCTFGTEGSNIVRGAVVNGGGATDFCARLLDKEDAPVRSFTVGLGEARK